MKKTTETTKMTAQDIMLAELQKKFKSKEYEFIKAHGGVALKYKNKRAFEVTKKRDSTYKVCAHKSTTITADLRNTAECEVQQNNYKFDKLSKEEMFFVCSELLKAKKTIVKNRDDLNKEK